MKYELTSDTIEVDGVTLHRIRALKSFGSVKAGDLGGYVQSVGNLSQECNCWVNDDAWVFGDARVFDNAQVCGDAQVYGDAWVFEDARVCGDAQVFGITRVFDKARVYGSAVIKRSYVYRNSVVSGMAVVERSYIINSEVGGFAEIIGQTIRDRRIMNPSDLELV